jgi:glutamyl-tRNA synthetase
MSEDQVRVRFAPSPTGLLHVGNARTALFNWLYARQHRGAFVLRVEDTDVERSTPEYERMLIENLRWLGLDWDEGPDKGGAFGPYRQSARQETYSSHTQRLLEAGRAYYCFCSPEELDKERSKARAAGKTPVYGGKCRSIPGDEAMGRVAAGEAASVRLRTPGQGEFRFDDLVRGNLTFDLAVVGDPVLVRSSGLPAYNYVVVIDDFLMRITHVIRGEDHLANTVRQILTYQAFDYPRPCFAHLSMVMGEDNARLSKRHGATAVVQFAQDGILASALFNYLALLGWAPPEGDEVLERDDLLRLFDLGRVSRSAAIFDYGKLHWLNRQHIKRLSPRTKAEEAFPHLQAAGFLPPEMTNAHWSWLEQAVEALSERVDTLSEFKDSFAQIFDFSLELLGEEERADLGSECGSRVVRSFAGLLAGTERLDFAAFAEMTKAIKDETGCKGRDLFHPLRIALTARGSGLDLDKFIPLVESGAGLDFPKPLKSCSERAAEALAFLDE